MTTKNLQMTEFYIEKLKTVVNVGGSSAYQILTARGSVLGQVGIVANDEIPNASNDASIEAVTTASAGRPASRPWLRRTLSTLFAR